MRWLELVKISEVKVKKKCGIFTKKIPLSLFSKVKISHFLTFTSNILTNSNPHTNFLKKHWFYCMIPKFSPKSEPYTSHLPLITATIPCMNLAAFYWGENVFKYFFGPRPNQRGGSDTRHYIGFKNVYVNPNLNPINLPNLKLLAG